MPVMNPMGDPWGNLNHGNIHQPQIGPQFPTGINNPGHGKPPRLTLVPATRRCRNMKAFTDLTGSTEQSWLDLEPRVDLRLTR